MWIAIEYSYKLGQKNEFKFWCELGWFLQRQSHIIAAGMCRDASEVYCLPVLDYASSIWDPYHQNQINKLEMIQHIKQLAMY